MIINPYSNGECGWCVSGVRVDDDDVAFFVHTPEFCCE